AAFWYFGTTVSCALRCSCAGAVATPARSSILVRSMSVSGGGVTSRRTVGPPESLPLARSPARWGSCRRMKGMEMATSPTATPIAIHWRIDDGVTRGGDPGQECVDEVWRALRGRHRLEPDRQPRPDLVQHMDALVGILPEVPRHDRHVLAARA